VKYERALHDAAGLQVYDEFVEAREHALISITQHKAVELQPQGPWIEPDAVDFGIALCVLPGKVTDVCPEQPRRQEKTRQGVARN
jgi:uncharacterized Fe-S cluster protein YjdI